MRFADGNPRQRYEERNGWVDYRMALFKKYCLPSVQAQNVDFDWWFLINRDFLGWKPKHTFNLSRYGRILWIEAAWREDQTEVGELLRSYKCAHWRCFELR